MDFRIALVTLFDFIIIAKNAVESLSDIADKRAKRIIIRKVFERRSRITFFIIRVIIRYYIDRGISISQKIEMAISRCPVFTVISEAARSKNGKRICEGILSISISFFAVIE